METKLWIKVVCDDVDGKHESIPIARFPEERFNDVLALVKLVRENYGSCILKMEEFLE